jgi:hypothetical protein
MPKRNAEEGRQHRGHREKSIELAEKSEAERPKSTDRNVCATGKRNPRPR